MNREGQKVPQVTFRTHSGNDWKNVTSDEIFKGRTVVVFSPPGAFTPTCSSTHLPRYNELAPAFFANGVDAIVCVSAKGKRSACGPVAVSAPQKRPEKLRALFAN